MVLRLELPKVIDSTTGAVGVTVYLDGERIYRVNTIDSSISKYADTAKWVDKYTCELEGTFEIRNNGGLIDIYGL